MRSPPKKEQQVHLTVRKTAEWEARVKHGTMENQCDDEEWEFIIPIILMMFSPCQVALGACAPPAILLGSNTRSSSK